MPIGPEPSVDPNSTARRLCAIFERIRRQRMTGLPILHPGLSVAVIGARQWGSDWTGVLVTPWCMNLVLIPGSGSDTGRGPIGSKQVRALPAGDFEFIASEEIGIGPFAACSLFSPMQVFADQAAAIATAESVIRELFQPRPDSARDARPEGERDLGLSRRSLLLGSRRGNR